MMQGIIHWGQQAGRALLPGAGLWVLLALGGGLYAWVQGGPVLPTIVTWDEWVAAVFFLGPFIVFTMNVVHRGTRESRGEDRFVDVSARLGRAGLAVFLLDLIIRAAFGLGWKPF
jgi:hypothetical protein